MTHTPVLAERKVAFLERLAQGQSANRACAELGLNRSSLYHIRSTDPEFARAWEACYRMAFEEVRDQVVEKALVATGRIVDVPLVDAAGDPVLDDDFEPVTVRTLVDYDPRVLVKLLDKTLASADGPGQTNVVVSNTTNVNALPPAPRIVRTAAPAEILEAEAVEVTEGATAQTMSPVEASA